MPTWEEIEDKRAKGIELNDEEKGWLKADVAANTNPSNPATEAGKKRAAQRKEE